MGVYTVNERCWDQREALPGEPRCVVCGRYGEYICDETDDDICSTECKSLLLSRLSSLSSTSVKSTTLSVAKFPAKDECFYVRDDGCGGIKGLRKNINASADSCLSFSSCNLPLKLKENLETAGFKIPTPVQMQVIPVALCKRSLLVSAETGSGKMASYLVPIIARCCDESNGTIEQDGKLPHAIILSPTRELCVQIEEQAKTLAKGLPFKTALVVGGDAMPNQVYRMNQGVKVIVATPGRLIDLLCKHTFDLSDVSIFVLDEVDCMLQRGFRDQVMQIFLALSTPQVLMFSATVCEEVEKMAGLISKDIMRVCVGKKLGKPVESVKQVVIWVDSKHKKQKLFEILTSKQHFKPPVVVFVESRLGADLLSEAIYVATGLKAVSIHGEKEMKDRRENLRLFLTGEVSIIVATGVLGRGVDLCGVKQVIIFDMPKSMEEYIHQVGRASRMRKEGVAIVFINQDDQKLFKELVDGLRSSGNPVPRELTASTLISPHGRGKKIAKKRKFGF